jgi:hypothetical protein
MRCLLICDKEALDPRTHQPYRATTHAWVDLPDAAAALLQAQADGHEVIGLLTQTQPCSSTGKRVLAVGAIQPRQQGGGE